MKDDTVGISKRESRPKIKLKARKLRKFSIFDFRFLTENDDKIPFFTESDIFVDVDPSSYLN